MGPKVNTLGWMLTTCGQVWGSSQLSVQDVRKPSLLHAKGGWGVEGGSRVVVSLQDMGLDICHPHILVSGFRLSWTQTYPNQLFFFQESNVG